MFKPFFARLKQGHQTRTFPPEPKLSERYRGLPIIEDEHNETAVELCPVEALALDPNGKLTLDIGRCIFCGNCEKSGAIRFSREYRQATFSRKELIFGAELEETGERLRTEIYKIFRRSLKLRVVSAGGCGACEADINVLTTLNWDISRFGIKFVASPKHADGIVVAGPVTANMKDALLKTYEAIGEPKVVIAVGACAISGGIYAGIQSDCNGIADLLPVDLFIPGCPPHPATILDGFLQLMRALNN